MYILVQGSHQTLPPKPFPFPEGATFYLQLSKVLSQLLHVHQRQCKEIVEVRALYRKEAMQRKLLFNEVGVARKGCGWLHNLISYS